MNSSVKIPERKYPYIGISKLKIIVLFHAPGKGIQLHHQSYKLGAQHEIGGYSDSIAEDNFELFSGEVTLSN